MSWTLLHTLDTYLHVAGAPLPLHLFTHSTCTDSLWVDERKLGMFSPAMCCSFLSTGKMCSTFLPHFIVVYTTGGGGGHLLAHFIVVYATGMGDALEFCWDRECWGSKISVASGIKAALDHCPPEWPTSKQRLRNPVHLHLAIVP